MVNLGRTTRKIKATRYTQYGTFTKNKKYRVTGFELSQLSHSREMAVSFNLFDNTDGTRYCIILVREFMKGIGLDIMNSALSLIWNELKVPMVDMGYWDDNMIDESQ